MLNIQTFSNSLSGVLLKDYLVFKEGVVNPQITEVDTLSRDRYKISFLENGEGELQFITVHLFSILEFIYISANKTHHSK